MTSPDDSVAPPGHHVPAAPREQFARIGGVSRTLMTSLLARHLASSREHPIIDDPGASTLIRELGLAGLGGDWSFRAVEVGVAVRTEILDTAVRDFAVQHPNPLIVTIGAGLCTRCIRLADLDVTWIDVDLPPVAALRRTLLPPGDMRTVLAESALDTGWRKTLESHPGQLLFILEGLTMYLQEHEVRELITDLADRFPGSELLIETVGTRHDTSGRFRNLRHTETAATRFTWGIRRLDELCTWHPQLQLRQQWHLMDYHRSAWPPLIKALRCVPGVRSQSKIGRFHVTNTA